MCRYFHGIVIFLNFQGRHFIAKLYPALFFLILVPNQSPSQTSVFNRHVWQRLHACEQEMNFCRSNGLHFTTNFRAHKWFNHYKSDALYNTLALQKKCLLYTYMSICTHIRTCTHTHTHTHMRTCTHAHTHTYTHTHTHTHRLLPHRLH